MPLFPVPVPFCNLTVYPVSGGGSPPPWSGAGTKLFPSASIQNYGITPETPVPANMLNYVLGNFSDITRMSRNAQIGRIRPGAPDTLTPGTGIAWDSDRKRWLACRKVSGTVMAAGVRSADGAALASVNTTLTATGAPAVGVYAGGGATKLAVFVTDSSTEALVINAQTLVMTKETLSANARGLQGPSILALSNGDVLVAAADAILKRAAGGTSWATVALPGSAASADYSLAQAAGASRVYAFNRDPAAPRAYYSDNNGTSWTSVGTPTGIANNTTRTFSTEVVYNAAGGNFLWCYSYENGSGLVRSDSYFTTDFLTWSTAAVAGNSASGYGVKKLVINGGIYSAIVYRKDAAATAGIVSEFAYSGPFEVGWFFPGVTVSPTNALAILASGDPGLALVPSDGSGGNPLFLEPREAVLNLGY